MKSWLLKKNIEKNLLETARATKSVPFEVAYQP